MEQAQAAIVKRRRRRRVLALLVLLVPLVLVGGAWLFLQSGAGEALVREQVLKAAGDALQGQLKARGVRLDGEHLVLEGLELSTPEGELVASIERLEADVELGALARQRVHLSHVKVSTPKLFLVEDERGWNLSRALAAKNPSPPTTTSSSPSRWTVQVDDLELFDGLLDLQQEARRITATRLGGKGFTFVKLDPLEVKGELDLRSLLTAPLDETLTLKATASTSEGPQRYAVDLLLGGTKLRGSVELPSLALDIDELVAAPRELSAFVPGYPVKQVVYGEGTLSPAHAKLVLRAGKGRVTVDSKHDLEQHAAERVAVSVRDVDLAELVGAPLSSLIDLDASGKLTDWRPDTLAGALDVKGTWTAKGQRLASLDASTTAAGGALDVKKLGLDTPGVRLDARGKASLQALGLEGTLVATDLSALKKTLATFAGLDIPNLAGRGRLQLGVKGPPDEPALKAVGKLEKLSVASVSADDVEVDADLPDLFHPADSDILLKSKRFTVAGRTFDEVTLDFITHGRELDLDLSTKGLGDLRVNVVGRLDRDSNGAEFDTLLLQSTDARWTLEQPMRVSWSPRVTVSPFSLRDGEQHLAGQLELRGTRLDAKVQAEKVQLDKLPKLLAIDDLELGGTLSADVAVTGRTSKPEVTARLEWRNGAVKGVRQLDVDLDGSWRDERATGRVDARSSLGRVAGRFDVPVMAFLDEKPEAGTAHLTLEGLELDALAQQLGRDLPAQGTVSGVLDVSGTGEQPKVKLTVTSPQLTGVMDERTVHAQNVEFVVATDDAHTLGAQVQLTGLGGQQQVTLSTPLTLASLRRGLPSKDALLELPVTLGLELQRVELAQLHQAGLLTATEKPSGALALSGTFKGTALAPTGQVIVTADDVHLGSLEGLSGKVTARTTEQGSTQLTADLSVTKQPAATLTATLSALPEKALRALLTDGGSVDRLFTAISDVPLIAELEVKPFDLGRVVPHRVDDPAPGGSASARLEVKGTLEDPNARLFGALKDLRFDRASLGSARFDLKSTAREQRFTVALGGQGRDDFKAKGSTGLDLRLSSLRKGFDWKKAPVELALDSRNFDLAFLSGATDQLRAVAGRLDLTGTVKGTLGAPAVEGDAEVRDGRLALAGTGDYRQIALQVHLDNQTLDLKKLEAKSGAGKASLVAKALKQSSGAWLLTSSGETDKFPIVTDDQLVATASLKYALEGDVTATLVDIRELALPRVDVRLPEVKRKDIQDLDRPGDIIILRGGKRPTSKQKTEAQLASVQKEPGLVIRALIDAPRNIWVRSSDVNIELGLSEGFRVEYREGVRLFGEARVMKGELEVIGRKFTVQKGSEARFAGAATQPYVNVTALHENTREQVKITVTVAGRGTDVAIKTTSEPPMPESDIYAVLATGRRNLKTSGGTALSPGQAASVVGQFATNFLKTGLAKALPIDVFNFESSDNFEKVKLDVGKYLSDSVYLGGSVNIGARRERGENTWAGRIELQLTRSVSLEAYAGDALSFGADAVWSKDF